MQHGVENPIFQNDTRENYVISCTCIVRSDSMSLYSLAMLHSLTLPRLLSACSLLLKYIPYIVTGLDQNIFIYLIMYLVSMSSSLGMHNVPMCANHEKVRWHLTRQLRKGPKLNNFFGFSKDLDDIITKEYTSNCVAASYPDKA